MPNKLTPVPELGHQDILYVDAISKALYDELEVDASVYLLGQDIASFGGAFKITRGFLEAFGPQRIVNTPIAESGTIGIAVGSALLGRRPIVEMQFADFISCGFNQVVNVAAKLFYRMERPVPLVIRLPGGGGVGAGAFHSQNVEAWFLHCPGLKVVAPATSGDAYSLLRSAIRDPNPVLFFEHKYLYRRERGDLPKNWAAKTVNGEARVVRDGSDVSVISYGWMVHRSLQAAETLAEEGISVEVIDLRVLAPLDEATLLKSAQKTGKVAIVQEATTTAGFGAEVAARLAEGAIDYLDGPIRRIGYPDQPVPFHKELEACCLPSPERITRVVRELVQW